MRTTVILMRTTVINFARVFASVHSERRRQCPSGRRVAGRRVAGSRSLARYHPAVTPLVLVAASLIALAAGVITLRSFGPRYRVARLLATTPRVSVAEAVAIARDGPARYVRIDGRIDAEEEFEDADHRPLVFRRTRFEARSGGRWSVFEDSREAVEFDIREGLDGIRVDAATLDVGLVVVPRHSGGVASDITDRAPSAIDPATPVRAIIEQVSSVEHAIVLGVPVPASASAANAGAQLTAGLGRPLVLTTLEPAEAMRILAGGSTRPRLVAVCFLAGIALLVAGLAWAGLGAVMSAVVPIARAASPSPATGGDPRSSGEGPGLVGEPLAALLVVAGIALLAVLLTTIYVRVTDTKSRGRD